MEAAEVINNVVIEVAISHQLPYSIWIGMNKVS